MSNLSKVEWKDLEQPGDNIGLTYGICFEHDGKKEYDWYYTPEMRDQEFDRAQKGFDGATDLKAWFEKMVRQIKSLAWLKDPRIPLSTGERKRRTADDFGLPEANSAPVMPKVKSPAPEPVGGDYATAINRRLKEMGE